MEGPVLITGGNGFLGLSLARRLLGERIAVRALVRSEEKGAALARFGAQLFIGDVSDRAAVAGAVDGVVAVYHLAGRLLVPGVPVLEYRRTHIEGTRVLLDCCRERSRIRRFVHCSTTGVLGVTGERPADETAGFSPTNIYEATKAEAEQVVRESWRDSFPAVIARPGLVYGPGDLHLLSFFRTVLRHQFRPIGSRPVWLHPIYIDDLSEALLLCGRHPAAVGECFHLAAREPVTLETLAVAIARAAGTGLPAGRIPVGAARAVALVGDRLPAGLRRLAPLTGPRLDFLTNSRVYSVGKAERLLGFVAATDLTTGMAQTIAWYRENGYIPAETPRSRKLA